jgi:hypothetical protein
MHYITYVMGIFSLPNCVSGTYEYIGIWIIKHYIQQYKFCNVVPIDAPPNFLKD